MTMRSKFAFVIIAVACILAANVALSAAGSGAVPPPWAYGFETPPGAPAAPAPPAAAPAAPDTSLKHFPGSDKEFTRQQIANNYGPADWFPFDHPPMPDIVEHGRM